jgi:dTDP-4-amino-4,6-dideoxygalactose transaminase
MIYVTKSFLPDLKEYVSYLERIWQSNHLTNDGPLLLELEKKLAEFLEVEHLLFVTNGTIALQLAIKALNLSGEVITTPFSYCATTNALIWEGCSPVFADIDPLTLTVTSKEIVQKLTPNTKGILTTHVYGNAGDLGDQEKIAQEYKIPLIYDGAHAFGVRVNNKSIFSYGTVSTCSFHATKIFHTVEGGAVMTNDVALANKIKGIRSFGHKEDDYFDIGINGKNSEFHAAMGLVNLSHFPEIREHRKWAVELYDQLIGLPIQKVIFPSNLERNFSYYPVILPTEEDLLHVTNVLISEGIKPRRYFYPSLNTIQIIQGDSCPVSEDIAKRVLCLPLSADINQEEITKISSILMSYFQ